jgi:uncharacterized protein YcgI (DUF1989 family)
MTVITARSPCRDWRTAKDIECTVYNPCVCREFSQCVADTGFAVERDSFTGKSIQNVSLEGDGRFHIAAPIVQTAQNVSLRAERNLALMLSACPMDPALSNGPERILIETFAD